MSKNRPQLLFSDKKGKIFSFSGLEAAGMKARHFFRFSQSDLIKLPACSSLFVLPGRLPLGFSQEDNSFRALKYNPFKKNREEVFAVSAFIAPGFTLTHNVAYQEIAHPKILPLFAYAPVCFYKNEFYVAAVATDREKRQDERLMSLELINKNVKQLRKIFPKNRLMRHLEGCALVNNCPAAKNFFLNRYEAPLPTSPFCNSRCLGCISYQPQNKIPVTQPRIKFFPSPEEISQTALYHLGKVRDAVVSFGQGCEGEPLMAGKIIEEAIRLMRRSTSKGIINLNTNASKPKIIARLFDCGLDSMRVSLNSAQEEYYNRYYKPQDYSFASVLDSIKEAKVRGGFVSLNYLTLPGFTDSQEEYLALEDLLGKYSLDMIQWRNLNFDPARYCSELKISCEKSEMLGIKNMINTLKKRFPRLLMGYFNPSRERIKRKRG